MCSLVNYIPLRWLPVITLICFGLLTACKSGDGTTSSQITPISGTPTSGGSVPWEEVPDEERSGGLGAASPENRIGAGFSFTGTGSEAGFADIAGEQMVAADPYPALESYPAPGGEVTAPASSSNGQYPAPGVDTSTSPYPGPGEPTQQVPYPAPDQSQTGTAYPPPQSSQPQATVPTLTPIPVTPTPTPLPTPIPLDARIIATDPSTVKLASGYLQLIEFFAYWDGYSKSMAPIINELEAQYVDQIVFVRLDVDDPATAFLKSELRYEKQPEYYLVDGDGTILAMWEGLVGMDEFSRIFNDVITQE